VSSRRPFIAFAAAAGAGVILSATVATGRPILASRWSLLGLLAAWAVAWIAGVVAAIHLPGRWAVTAIIIAGMALRVAAIAGPPTTSDDLYRYSWDGRVQVAGVDPYAQPPDSPALAALREPWLWPDAVGCAALHRPPGCSRINRPSQLTIYPPLAEAWFVAAYRVAGPGARHKTWQVAGLATELGVLALLSVALRRSGRDTRWVALYALSPAPVLEVVNNGHVDGLAVVCVVAALAVATGPPTWRRDVAFGALIGAAAMVKVYPAVLIVVIAGATGQRIASVTRAGATAGAVGIAGYLPHFVRVGRHVLGYLPGYLHEEHYSTGGRFLLASLTRLPSSVAGTASVLAVAAVGIWVLVRRPSPPLGGALLVGGLLLATSPVQPWYAVSLLAVATIGGAPEWAAVVAAGYPYFFAVILDNRSAARIGTFGYAAALAVVAAAVIGASTTRASRQPTQSRSPGSWPRLSRGFGSRRPRADNCLG